MKRVITVIAALTFVASQASLAASATPQFRVDGSGLEADPDSYSGPCPSLIKFKGKIQSPRL